MIIKKNYAFRCQSNKNELFGQSLHKLMVTVIFRRDSDKYELKQV